MLGTTDGCAIVEGSSAEISHEPKTPRRSLSLDQRKRVIELKEKGVSLLKLMEEFKCGKSQIWAIIRNKKDIMKNWEVAENREMKRRRELKFDEVDDHIFKWFQHVRAKGCAVTGPMVQKRARHIAEELRISGFSASNGWLESFGKRHNITFSRRSDSKKNCDSRRPRKNMERKGKTSSSNMKRDVRKFVLEDSSAAICHKPKTSLSLDQRKRVIVLNEKGVKVPELMEIFECGKTQICTILKNKDNIIEDWEVAENREIKRKCQLKFREVDDYVFEWFQCVHSAKYAVNGPMLQKKARKIAEELRISGFSASNGWLESFRKRHNITFSPSNDSEKQFGSRRPRKNIKETGRTTSNDSEGSDSEGSNSEMEDEGGSRRTRRGSGEMSEKSSDEEIEQFVLVSDDESEVIDRGCYSPTISELARILQEIDEGNFDDSDADETWHPEPEEKKMRKRILKNWIKNALKRKLNSGEEFINGAD